MRSAGAPLRILVVGDAFMPVTAFAEAFAPLESAHTVEYLQLAVPDPPVAAGPEVGVAESQGDPRELVPRMEDVDVLVVHAAPVTSEVLAASTALRFVGCARGGPVNVDIEAAAGWGSPW